ncbi:glycosyltransferase [Maribacter sp. BPC-D8]|uniref:glycosyltransferase n=1 Tax=Maribacter sp. BPC-D8 TaxID=3053613 RepID=UPI002B4A19CC|nr:glycosyltransferase [Maribacter sp. BPC-D8]WRI31282.1 glycosyltransferase [Maribacter sp. BPC-D8]
MANKKRIAFLLSIITERGGIGRVTSLISDQLNNIENFEIHIISYAKKGPTSYGWNDEIPYHYLLENQTSMKKGIFKASKRLRNILAFNKIDILISCGQIVGPLGVLSTVFNKTKLIYWSHTSFKGASKKQFRMFNEHITATFSTTLITLTKADEENYSKETLAKRVVQIYNPIDAKLEKQSKMFLPNTNKIISVGRLSFEKNFEDIIDIAKIVKMKYPNLKWHIYGSGEHKKTLEQRIEEKGVKDIVILMGQSNKLYELYNDYSLMVMTSRYEGFPMSLLEGLASQLPLISYDVPTGPNEIIRENINGYLIEPFNQNEMANKIIHLLAHPDKMMEFSRNNKKFKTEYSLKNIINKWEETLMQN